MKSEGLRPVSNSDLKKLLQAVYRDLLLFPVTRSGLVSAAFGHIEQHLDLLVGLEKLPAQRLLVAVIAERRLHQV